MNEKTRTHHTTRRLARAMVHAGLMAATLAFGSAAHATINFTFDYGDTTPVIGGFWDPTADVATPSQTLGQTRQDAMTTASDAFAAMFATHFTNSATILLSATATNDSGSSNLASAGTTAAGGYGVGFTVNEYVKTKALGGVNPNGPTAIDGNVNVNFGQPWYYGTDAGAVPADQYDFYSTINHEFTHALGFSSGINQDGSPFFGGTKAQGEWVTFDQFLVAKDGPSSFVNVVNADFSLNQAAWDMGSLGGASPAGGMFFNGSFATAANGGNPVGLYSPANWAEGSSVSHTDDDNGTIYGTMMTAFGPTGPWPRDYSKIEVAMMQDLGYTVAAPVPEPETYAMMLVGLGLIGAMARRRKI